jgi:hypothetical protein
MTEAHQSDGGHGTGAIPEGHILSAVVPSRLAARTPPETVRKLSSEAWWMTTQKVACDWQGMSAWADFWEVAAPRIQYGRSHDLVGCIADGGERLALALAGVTEAELWRVYRQDIPPEVRQLDAMKRRLVDAANEMAHRAMAELASYYLLAAGHAVANVTARTLALDSQLHAKLLDLLGSWYPVNSSEREDWLSLNKETVRRLRRAARQATIPAARDLAEPSTALLMSQAWQDLDQLRGAHYHRRRPQSAGIAGVPLNSPWRFAHGMAHMDGGGDQYLDGDGLADKTTDLARRALDDLASVMQRLLIQVQLVVGEMNSAGDGAEPA